MDIFSCWKRLQINKCYLLYEIFNFVINFIRTYTYIRLKKNSFLKKKQTLVKPSTSYEYLALYLSCLKIEIESEYSSKADLCVKSKAHEYL
jgi:hypothetical protein